MLSKVLHLSVLTILIGAVACSKDSNTAGITEEGNSIAFDLWNGANGMARVNINGGSGYWFSVDDEDEGGSSQIDFPTLDGHELTSDNMESLVSHCGGLCGTVELGDASAPSAGVGIALTEKDTTVDISEWDGVCVSYESELAMRGELGYKNGSDASDDMLSVNFDKTEKGAVAARCAKWADFKRNSSDDSGAEASKKATSLVFKFIGKAKESGYFNIKGVSSYKHGVENLDSVETVKATEVQDDNVEQEPCLWNGTSSNPSSFVWEGSPKIKGGLWYSYNDRNDGGASLLYWSAEAPSYKNSIELLTDEELFEGGLSASVALDMGSASRAYAGVGIKMAVKEDSGDTIVTATDISDWGGICVYYMAEKDMRMVLASDSLEKDYTLAASTTPVEKCVTWDDFSGSGLAEKATDIKFEVHSSENVFNQIHFNIIAVGRYDAKGVCSIDTSKVTSF